MAEIHVRDRNRIMAALTSIAMLVLIGTVTTHYLESWSWVDSFYFTAMTVTTVGHGELYPSGDATKILQVLLAFAGVMIVVYSMSVVGSIFFRQTSSSPVAKEIAQRVHKMREHGLHQFGRRAQKKRQ
jgi:voltage-gated potassium channel